jgi:ribosomal protein S18 acetylase RimI-like enzyme
VQQTRSHAEAIAWAGDIAGTPNVAWMWIPENGFIKAVAQLGSLALTRQAEHVFGLGIGPDPEIDSSWQRVLLPRALPLDKTAALSHRTDIDVYTASTTFAPMNAVSEPLSDMEEIASFLTLHAPDSSTHPNAPESLVWFGMRDGYKLIAAATIAKWESGAYMLSSVGVHREYRGRGLGTQLSRDALYIGRHNNMPYINLAVHGDNHAAIATYRKAGYRCVAEMASYDQRPPTPNVTSLLDLDPATPGSNS